MKNKTDFSKKIGLNYKRVFEQFWPELVDKLNVYYICVEDIIKDNDNKMENINCYIELYDLSQDSIIKKEVLLDDFIINEKNITDELVYKKDDIFDYHNEKEEFTSYGKIFWRNFITKTFNNKDRILLKKSYVKYDIQNSKFLFIAIGIDNVFYNKHKFLFKEKETNKLNIMLNFVNPKFTYSLMEEIIYSILEKWVESIGYGYYSEFRRILSDTLSNDIETAVRKILLYNLNVLYEDINAISNMTYETAGCNGEMIFIWDDEINDLNMIVFKNKVQLFRNNYKIIRKLLEMCQNNNVLVVNNKGHLQKQFIIGMCNKDILNLKRNFYSIEFLGKSKWHLKLNYNNDDDDRILSHDENGFYDDRIRNLSLWDDKIKEFFNCECGKIINIVNEIKKQKHGAVLIVFKEYSDAEKESDRLCECNRGIRLNIVRYDNFKNNVISMSSIDGAVICDIDGNCYAIGVILDGKASSKGNISRGARFNSTISYVDSRSEKVVGFIISEDGDINFYSRNDIST